ncbi:MAG TPA: hypothetical protein VGJ84_06585 [Polyangiaceae bacterium]
MARKSVLGAILLAACSSQPVASNPTPDGGQDTGAADCSAAAAGIQVNPIDLNGYPPYSVDGCKLVYVSSPSGTQVGALVLRDLLSGTETVLAPPESAPRRPSIRGSVIAWEELNGGIPAVQVRANDTPLTISGPFDHAGEPRAGADAVVFTGWLTADDNGEADVFVYRLETGAVELVFGGPAQQRFADISATHIAASDFSEDPTGTYDPLGIALADVVVVERSTGIVTRRFLPGKQAYPMLGADGQLAYLEWIGVRPMPKLESYDVRAVALSDLSAPGQLVAQVNTDPPAIRPAALGQTLEWVARSAGLSTLWRAPLDLSQTPTAVPGLEGLDLYAPAATTTFTVLATEPTGTSALLRSVTR